MFSAIHLDGLLAFPPGLNGEEISVDLVAQAALAYLCCQLKVLSVDRLFFDDSSDVRLVSMHDTNAVGIGAQVSLSGIAVDENAVQEFQFMKGRKKVRIAVGSSVSQTSFVVACCCLVKGGLSPQPGLSLIAVHIHFGVY